MISGASHRSLFPVCVLLAAAVVSCADRPAESEASRAESAALPYVPDTKPAPPVRWVQKTVPAGTALQVVAGQEVPVAGTSNGDTVEVLVEEALRLDDLVVVPSGSRISGMVAGLRPDATGAVPVLIAWNRIETPTGAGAALAARTPRQARAGGNLLDKGVPFELKLDEPLTIGVRQ